MPSSTGRTRSPRYVERSRHSRKSATQNIGREYPSQNSTGQARKIASTARRSPLNSIELRFAPLCESGSGRCRRHDGLPSARRPPSTATRPPARRPRALCRIARKVCGSSPHVRDDTPRIGARPVTLAPGCRGTSTALATRGSRRPGSSAASSPPTLRPGKRGRWHRLSVRGGLGSSCGEHATRRGRKLGGSRLRSRISVGAPVGAPHELVRLL